MKKFEYKHIRLDYKGRGITQEINILDIDGENKSELKKLREAMERIEGEPSGIIDI